MCVQVLVWKLCIFTPRIHVILYFLICYFSVDGFALLQTPLCSCCYLETSAHPGSGQPRSVLSGWKHGGTARPELVAGGLLCARACMMRAAGTTQFFPPPEPIIILSHFPTQCRQSSVTERVDECVKGRLMAASAVLKCYRVDHKPGNSSSRVSRTTRPKAMERAAKCSSDRIEPISHFPWLEMRIILVNSRADVATQRERETRGR